jgi:hypothetical protein
MATVRHRRGELAGDDRVAGCDGQRGQQRHRPAGLDVLQQQQVVAEPAHHPRFEACLAAQPPGQLGHVRARPVTRPRLLRARGEIHHPAPGERVLRRQDENDRIGSQRNDLQVGLPRERDPVGGRDDHVQLAGAQGEPALVRLGLDQLHVQVWMRVCEPGGCGDGQGVDRALEHPEPDGADRLVVQRAQLRLRLRHPLQDLPAPAGQQDAGPGQPQPAPGPLQERAAGLGLQHGELLRHRGGAQME